MSISENLKTARKASGLTQAAVAARLGVSNTTLSNWENNVSRPDVDTLRTLCTMYDIRPNEVFEWQSSSIDPSHTALTPEELADRLKDRTDLQLLLLYAERAKKNHVKLVTDLLEQLSKAD